jgi:hypothetical protein
MTYQIHYQGMTMNDALRTLDSLAPVTASGGSIVGDGRLWCFEAHVEAQDLTDVVQQRIEQAIEQSLYGDVTVSSTKGIVTTDGEDACVIWAFAYTKTGQTVVGGISYDIIDHNDNGVIAIMSDVTGADPSSGLTTFNWGEIEWQPPDETEARTQ